MLPSAYAERYWRWRLVLSSPVSSEKPKGVTVREIAAAMRRTKEAGQRILAVLGPALVHTGGADQLCELIRLGYLDVIFAGNGLFNITGTTYAANAHVRVSGNGDATIYSQYISRALTINGNGAVNIVYNPATVAPVRVLQLVE